jgi:hypothetical protein
MHHGLPKASRRIIVPYEAPPHGEPIGRNAALSLSTVHRTFGDPNAGLAVTLAPKLAHDAIIIACIQPMVGSSDPASCLSLSKMISELHAGHVKRSFARIQAVVAGDVQEHRGQAISTRSSSNKLIGMGHLRCSLGTLNIS